MVKGASSIKLNYVEAGKGVYSGLYILSKYTLSEIRNTIQTDEFIEYIQALKNYKNGGYFSFSSSELEKYLSFKLERNIYGQPSLFASDF